VVCNPPYIPDPPGGPIDRSRLRTGAVAGLSLIDQILESLPALLSESGRLLLLVSSVTPPEYVRERVPSGFVIASEPLGDAGQEVLFEVEEVFTRPGYLPFLESRGGLRMSEDSYIHQLHAFWITREVRP
jgi:methylase of polypeptide subunit release factors